MGAIQRQHAGFYAGVDEIYGKIIAELQRQGIKNKRLWVTGHSLGGALAAVFSYRAASEDQIRTQGVVTFGQPLVFGEATAQVVLDEFGTDYVRFVNSWHPITRCLPNYRHAGARVHLTRTEHSYRRPVISVKSAGNDGGPSGLMFIEDDEELLPMTDDEFNALEQQWNQPQSGTMPLTGGAGHKQQATCSSIPFFRRHQTITYIDQITREKEKQQETK